MWGHEGKPTHALTMSHKYAMIRQMRMRRMLRVRVEEPRTIAVDEEPACLAGAAAGGGGTGLRVRGPAFRAWRIPLRMTQSTLRKVT